MTRVFATWKNWEAMTISESLLVSVICILLVFLVLALLIFICWAVNAVTEKIVAKTSILPKEENKILEEDEDAVVAVLTATIDFHKETGKDANVISVKRIED